VVRRWREVTVGESVLSRMGRVIAGAAHAAVSEAESRNPAAVIEQAMREIDAAADDVRRDLGAATAERHRIVGRKNELQREASELGDKIAAALQQAREDLARSGVGRQVDLEAQLTALDRALADVDSRIGEGRKALHAVSAARADAAHRLAELRRSEARMASDSLPGEPEGNAALSRIAQSSEAIARVSGVPSLGQPADAEALEQLAALHRGHLIEERLAALKARN
jgi:phage shock protein A